MVMAGCPNQETTNQNLSTMSRNKRLLSECAAFNRIVRCQACLKRRAPSPRPQGKQLSVEQNPDLPGGQLAVVRFEGRTACRGLVRAFLDGERSHGLSGGFNQMEGYPESHFHCGAGVRHRLLLAACCRALEKHEHVFEGKDKYFI